MKKISALLRFIGPLQWKNVVFALILGFFCHLSVGCQSFQNTLFDVHWKPVEKAPEGVFLVFTADQRRVVGCCGSNRFFGPVSFGEDNKISIGMLGATRMASPHYKYEQKFLDDLQAAKSYRFESNGVLTLLDTDGEVCLQLKAVPPPPGGEK